MRKGKGLALVLLLLTGACGSMPALPSDNEPSGGPIKINNASLRFVRMVPCGMTGNQMCHAYDISFTLTNTSASSTGAVLRVDQLLVTVNGQVFTPATTTSCSQLPWTVSDGATSQVIDVGLQTEDPYIILSCQGHDDVQAPLPGLPALPTTGMIGLTIEGLLVDATPFKTSATVTIF